MKVYVTANLTEAGLARLRGELGMEVVYDPWSAEHRILMSEDLAEKLKAAKAEAVILEVDLCHEEVFESVDLKFIGVCRGDPLNVDVDEATSRGIPVFFTPARNADAVADLTLAFMICQLRNVISAHNLLVSGTFDPESPSAFMAFFRKMTGFELGSRVAGIVGLGAVGSAVAKRLQAFGATILAYDPYAPAERLAQYGAKRVELAELFRESDLVTLHAADVDETEGMITAELIAAMKPTAFFLNLARAQLVDNDALYQALKEKKIAGAAFDVFQSEPPRPDEPFIHLDNVIVTPHLGGATHDVVRHQTDIVLDDIAAFLAGRKPRYCVNPKVLK
jgi:D-3-phosphoglycerate dehydrogenase / 2-oxoglutarate reductase